MNARDELRLRHMRDAATNARRFVADKARSDLDRDEMLAYAVIHALQVIGEAASRIALETQAQYPSIDWKNITGMRHRLVHDYDNVDFGIVWQVLTDDLPVLLSQLDAILPPASIDDTAS